MTQYFFEKLDKFFVRRFYNMFSQSVDHGKFLTDERRDR